MTTSAHSRLGMMNTRERKPLILGGSDSTEVSSTPSGSELPPQRNNESQGLKLTLPEANTYEPTNAFTSSRTQMRMLKVKVDKGSVTNPERTSINMENTGQGFMNAPLSTTEMNHTFKPKPQDRKVQLSNPNGHDTGADFRPVHRPPLPQQSGLKLMLPDDPGLLVKEERKTLMTNPLGETREGLGKRIIMSQEKRGESRERRINIQKPPEKKEPEPVVVPPPPVQAPSVKMDEIPIQSRANQEVARKGSMENIDIESENDLVECPQGCGRKFNKKALETHAKACKIVFMSKRKQFNSQAKRIDNKEQANLVKQAKQKEKKEQFGTTKFEKTGQAWKTQSEGFRAVVKALKQEEVKVGSEEVQVVNCEYCDKKFNEIIYPKHLLICEAKKEKERKPPAKKGSKRQ